MDKFLKSTSVKDSDNNSDEEESNLVELESLKSGDTMSDSHKNQLQMGFCAFPLCPLIDKECSARLDL
ncbi:hypothetical protein ACLKA6_008737 [Drosophila palustris]